MSTFTQFFNQYTNQIKNREAAKLQREQVMAARGANYAQAAQSKMNQILGKGGFELVGSDYKANLDVLHNPNNAKDFVEFINFDNNVRKYYDEEGNVVSGTLLSPTKIKNESGEDKYIFNIEKKDGSIAPVTINRTSDPNDRILEFSKEDLANFYNTQAANLAVKGGISGYAAGRLQGQILGRKAEAQLAGAEMLSDSNLSPDSLINGIGQLNETLKSLTSEEEKAEIDAKPDGLDVETIGPEAAPELVGPQIETTKETESLIDQAVAAQQQRFSTRGSEFNQSGAFVESSNLGDESILKSIGEAWDNASTEERLLWISNGLILVPGLGAGAVAAKTFAQIVGKSKFARGLVDTVKKTGEKLVTRPAKKQLPETLQKGRAATPPPTGAREFSPARTTFTAGVTSNVAIRSSGGPEAEAAQQQELPELEPVPTIPTDLKGATEWFNNPDNQAALKRLPPEQVDSVRKLLQENNINSKEALVEAKRRNELSDIEYAKAAAVIAFSYNRGEDVGASQTIFNSLMNLGQTGSPTLNSVQVANYQLARDKFNNELEQQRIDATNEFGEKISDIYTVLGKEGVTSPQYTNQLKATLSPFLRKARFDRLTQTDKELMDGLLATTLIEYAKAQDSEDWADWIGDWFRADAKNTVGNSMDNIAIEYEDGKPARVVALNTAGNKQIQAEESITWNDFTGVLGEQNLIQYFTTRAKKIGDV